MKLRFTSRDFILLLGIMVAAIIAIATLFFGDGLTTIRPGLSKKGHSYNAKETLLKTTTVFLVKH